MIECECDVTPDQAWSEDGTAEVELKPSCGSTETLNLPLKHFPSGQQVVISKDVYPDGLVVVPPANDPSSSTKTLACRISNGDSIILKKQDWPYGAVGVFRAL
jgi:hypothetical protein